MSSNPEFKPLSRSLRDRRIGQVKEIPDRWLVAQLLLYRALLLRRNTDKFRNARWNLQFLYQIRRNGY
jgi:hypothetical protein